MKTKWRFFVALLLFILLGGTAVALSDMGKVCLFSAISGVITKDGQPVTQARLIRTANRDGDFKDETITDDNGHFAFPAMYERSITKYLPTEFVASQEIMVEYKNQTYELWSGVKRNPGENTESRGKSLIVNCKLEAEINHIWVNGAVFSTMCKWDVEPDSPINMEQPFEPDT